MRVLRQFLFLLSILLVFSCEDSNFDELDQKLVSEDFSNVQYGDLILPEGTVGTYSADKSSVKILLPKNIKYIANQGNTTITAFGGEYTCTSTCSGGCDVVLFGGNVGCTACPEGSSDECVGKHTKKKTIEDNFQIGDGTGGGFINLDKGITFSQKSDIEHQLDAPDWDVLINHPIVNKKFDEFYRSYWPSGEPDVKNSKSIVVNVFGANVKLFMPLQMDNRNVPVIEGDDVTCKCSSGSSGCTYKAVKKGIIKVGDSCVSGACTSCTMTF